MTHSGLRRCWHTLTLEHDGLTRKLTRATEAYDRLSPSFAAYLETLTAYHEAKFFKTFASALGNSLRDDVRGSPLNHGDALEAVHPVIRVNPVTGSFPLIVKFETCGGG